MNDTDNIIIAVFNPEFHKELYELIKKIGPTNSEKILLEQKYNISFIKASIKRILRTKGW